jgi:hypothetical protein
VPPPHFLLFYRCYLLPLIRWPLTDNLKLITKNFPLNSC